MSMGKCYSRARPQLTKLSPRGFGCVVVVRPLNAFPPTEHEMLRGSMERGSVVHVRSAMREWLESPDNRRAAALFGAGVAVGLLSPIDTFRFLPWWAPLA